MFYLKQMAAERVSLNHIGILHYCCHVYCAIPQDLLQGQTLITLIDMSTMKKKKSRKKGRNKSEFNVKKKKQFYGFHALKYWLLGELHHDFTIGLGFFFPILRSSQCKYIFPYNLYTTLIYLHTMNRSFHVDRFQGLQKILSEVRKILWFCT